MIQPEEFDRVCRLAKLAQPKVGVHVWSTVDKLEAVELTKDGRVITFWNKNGERIYDNPVSAKNIQDVYECFNGKDVAKELSKTISSETKTDGAVMPENLTNALFEKWQKMTVPERLIMLQTTDSRYIKERPGRAGKIYPYVEGHYMVMCANMAFGFHWSSHVQQWEKTGTEIICMGYVEAKIDNQVIQKYAVGQKDISMKKDSAIPVCIGDDYKAAEMDMIKKALSFFGIAKDVYSGDI